MRHAEFMWRMDVAITREGGPQALGPEDLRKVCFHRGLNPMNQRHSDLLRWLDQWLLLSSNCDGKALNESSHFVSLILMTCLRGLESCALPDPRLSSTETTFSLLLHSPLLLSFNHPSNRRLLVR